MKDRSDAGSDLATHYVVSEICVDELDVIPDVGEVLFVSGREVVHHPYVVSKVQQPIHYVGADESGPTGYQRYAA